MKNIFFFKKNVYSFETLAKETCRILLVGYDSYLRCMLDARVTKCLRFLDQNCHRTIM